MAGFTMLREVLVHIAVSMVLVCCSWWVFFQSVKPARGARATSRFVKEVVSVLLAVAAYSVLFLQVCIWQRRRWNVCSRRVLRICFIVASLGPFLEHLCLSWVMPDRNKRQTEELILLLLRFISDIIFFFCGCGVLLLLAWGNTGGFRTLKRHYGRYHFTAGVGWGQRSLVVVAGLIALLMILMGSFFFSMNAKELLEVGMLGDRVDFCGLEGMQLSRSVSTGWVIPHYVRRKLLDLYGDGDKCSANSISFLDEDEGVLIVSPVCPDGVESPTIYLEHPERSELNGGTDLLPRVSGWSRAWHQILNKRYGRNKTAHRLMGVRVNRDKRDVIKSVEVLPSHLIPVQREPRTLQERIARAGWPSTAVWRVALGESEAYTVYCPSTDHEEYHIFPPPRHSGRLKTLPEGSGMNDTAKLSHPPANVLLLIFDSVSRQEVVRSLPKFTAWLRQFRSDPSDQHIFVEAKGATTVGYATYANLVPLFSGVMSWHASTKLKRGFKKRSLFRMAKSRYGPYLGTSFVTGDCYDTIAFLLRTKSYGPGFGEGREDGIDYNTYGPFCHLQYSALENNFQGSNSILKRCIGQNYVHQHVLNYTRALLKRRLRSRRWQMGGAALNDSLPLLDNATFFFDVSHFMEGHEGSHGVLHLVDDALTAFLEELRTDLRFFDDPSNVLMVISDHGNHMGPYIELTSPGRLERALPFAFMIIHPKVMSNIDLLKGVPEGSSHRNLLRRTNRISTHLDLYMTLADLLGVEAKPTHWPLVPRIPPSSLFEERADSSHVKSCSDILSESERKTGCYLMWCEQKG